MKTFIKEYYLLVAGKRFWGYSMGNESKIEILLDDMLESSGNDSVDSDQGKSFDDPRFSSLVARIKHLEMRDEMGKLLFLNGEPRDGSGDYFAQTMEEPFKVALDHYREFVGKYPSAHDILESLVSSSASTYTGGIFYFNYVMQYLLNYVDLSNPGIAQLARLTMAKKRHYKTLGGILCSLKNLNLSNEGSTELVRQLISETNLSYPPKLVDSIKLVGTELSRDDKKTYLKLSTQFFPEFAVRLGKYPQPSTEEDPYLTFINIISRLDPNQNLAGFVARYVKENADSIVRNLAVNNTNFFDPLTKLTNFSQESIEVMDGIVSRPDFYEQEAGRHGPLLSTVKTLNLIEGFTGGYYTVFANILEHEHIRNSSFEDSVGLFLIELHERTKREFGGDQLLWVSRVGAFFRNVDQYLKLEEEELGKKEPLNKDDKERYFNREGYLSNLTKALKRDSIPLSDIPLFAYYWFREPNPKSHSFFNQHEDCHQEIVSKGEKYFDELKDLCGEDIANVIKSLHGLDFGLGNYSETSVGGSFSRYGGSNWKEFQALNFNFLNLVYSYSLKLKEKENSAFMGTLQQVSYEETSELHATTPDYMDSLGTSLLSRIAPIKNETNPKWEILHDAMKDFSELPIRSEFEFKYLNKLIEHSNTLMAEYKLDVAMKFFHTGLKVCAEGCEKLDLFLKNWKTQVFNYIGTDRSPVDYTKIKDPLEDLLDSSNPKKVYEKAMDEFSLKRSERRKVVGSLASSALVSKRRGSTKAQLEGIKSYSFYGTETQLVIDYSAQVIEHMRSNEEGDTAYIVDLGCGDGKKIFELAYVALQSYDKVNLCLVDCADKILDEAEENVKNKMSEKEVSQDRFSITRVHSEFKDLQSHDVYDKFIDSADGNLLHAYLGTTFCNEELEDSAKLMQGIMTNYGLFGIFTYEIELEEEIKRSYKTDFMKKLAYQTLLYAGYPDEYDPELLDHLVRFVSDLLNEDEELHRIEIYFKLKSEEFGKRSEKALISIKPTVEQMLDVLEQHKFNVIHHYGAPGVHLYFTENKATSQ